MHKIDLLKGQGIPAKTTSAGIFVLVVMVIAPILAAAGTIDWYLRTKTEMGVMQRQIDNAQKTIAENAADIKLQNSRQREIALLNGKLMEVSRCLGTFLQWTPVIKTLAQEMPGPMIISDLKAQSSGGQRRIRTDNDPNQPLTIPAPERTLVMNIQGVRPGSFNRMVENYQKSLSESPVLQPKLKEIVPAKETSTAGTSQTESYVMNIIFASKKQ